VFPSPQLTRVRSSTDPNPFCLPALDFRSLLLRRRSRSPPTHPLDLRSLATRLPISSAGSRDMLLNHPADRFSFGERRVWSETSTRAVGPSFYCWLSIAALIHMKLTVIRDKKMYMYRSYKLLSRPSPNVRRHDFIDDLESFLYVLYHAAFLCNPGGTMNPISSHEMLHRSMYTPKA